MSSKELNSNNLRIWNDALAQLARNSPPRVIQMVSAPIVTPMASRRVYPMTGIHVDDNAVVNNVVEVMYEVLARKDRKVRHGKWAHNATTLHPTNVQ